MNLLITGANGFIGRALTNRLLSDAARLPAGVGPIGRLTLMDVGFEGPEMPRVRRLSGSIADPAEKADTDAGFSPVLQFTSARIGGLRWLRALPASAADPGLVDAARRRLGLRSSIALGVVRTRVH